MQSEFRIYKTAIIIIFAFALLPAGSRSEEIFKMMAGARLENFYPQGEFTRVGFEPALGGGVALEYLLADEFGMYFSTGYSYFQNQFHNDTMNSRYADIPLSAGGVYYFDITDLFYPYAGFEIGMHIINLSYIETTYDPVDPRILHYRDADNISWTFGWAFNMGALYPLSDRFSVNLNMKYASISDVESMRIFGGQYYKSRKFAPQNYEENVELLSFGLGLSCYF